MTLRDKFNNLSTLQSNVFAQVEQFKKDSKELEKDFEQYCTEELKDKFPGVDFEINVSLTPGCLTSAWSPFINIVACTADETQYLPTEYDTWLELSYEAASSYFPETYGRELPSNKGPLSLEKLNAACSILSKECRIECTVVKFNYDYDCGSVDTIYKLDGTIWKNEGSSDDKN